MKKITFLQLLLTLAISGFSQYKNDNVSFKTVFPQDLCKELESAKEYMLLDVRSKGEYEDTSSSKGLNLGHLKNAVNIDVQELGKRILDISGYKNKPVFVYCSHSQRSRRASKMLADSGFTNIININGGITAVHQLPENNCANNLLTTHVGYTVINAASLCTMLSAKAADMYILDVRSDSAFAHITTDGKINGMGYFKNSVNIPLALLKEKINSIPTGKNILVVDLFGNDAAAAAEILVQNHYAHVSVLLEGINRYLLTDSKIVECMGSRYISPAKYNILSSVDLNRFTATNTDYLVLDVRTVEEFTNKHKDYWRNGGHIVNAVNIPLNELKDKLATIKNYMNKPVIVYDFGGGKTGYEAAAMLTVVGFTHVNVLAGGLFNIRWTAANTSGNSALFKLVTDVPESNQ